MPGHPPFFRPGGSCQAGGTDPPAFSCQGLPPARRSLCPCISTDGHAPALPRCQAALVPPRLKLRNMSHSADVPLHSDEFVTLYRDRLVVHWYYFPFAGDKVVPLDQVRRVHTGYFAGATPPRYLPSPEAAAKSGVYGGKVLDMWDWKHWGMALNFDTWWSCDLGRDGKDNWIAIELDDTHVKVGFAVDTHTHTGLLAKIHRATLAARKELDRPYDLCQ
ncbi:hypothetical protein, variant [Fonticula alba]|uniref:Uncharacterized protein n=1 Tax=Fonticula alba TaxID=691883 RepID=A0A058Z9E1_FONAL|nr:hypothetical protein, variant [Fonticula alba]KCV70929.1 hypothetical protein, variant [Fonticula alba]|eukprot:XP_009494051.1 hypothetical protein, variant [Fonticula alba]